MTSVCHISPVHALDDNRVFHKQCRSLREAGYAVSWVVQNDHNEVVDGQRIVALRPTKSLLWRWTFTGFEAFVKALRTKSSLYHFHDPEFIPYGMLLRLFGCKVIYDIHEDYVSSVSQKKYLPTRWRPLLGRIAGAAEAFLANRFSECVIAERYYEDRFPDAVKVLNYPRLTDDNARCRRSDQHLIYTGNVHPFRGAHIHARIPGLVDGTSVSFVGRCHRDLYLQLCRENQLQLSELEFVGVDQHVPYTEIARRYREGAWLAGLAIFPPNEHLEKKELTKFFEYMQFGIPIIASNFPTWKRLVEDKGCGICVNPNDDAEIADAVQRLRDDATLWQSMSDNGIRAVREHYSWTSQETTLLDLYSGLLGTKS